MTSRFCFLATALASAGLLAAEDPDVVFRSDVSLVRVDAQVVDRDNRAITGLRATDFVLREEGRAQPIRNFASENMPVDVLLLLDVSGSMRPHVQRIADAAHQALRALGPEDRVGIMVFDRHSRLRLPFRKSRSDVEREFELLLDQETFRGGTDITRGLYDAAGYVSREARRDARRAIVILTDDQTEFNRDEEGVERALIRADAVLCALLAPDESYRMGAPGGRYPRSGGSWPGSGGGPWGGGGVILGPRGGGGPAIGRGSQTRSAGTAGIARQSGGDSMRVEDSYSLENTLARIRQRYAVYFSLPPGVKRGQQRTIEVSLADAARRRYPFAEVRYRRLYLAPVDGGPASGEPATVTEAPAEGSREPGPRRRPPVGDTPVSRRGPLDLGGGAAEAAPPRSSPRPAPAQGVWREADQPAEKPAAGDTTPSGETAPAAPKGGWRKATPEDQKPNP
ncbi:MAG TPA: VWA domain-containing protein [Bryobacteraceae bacterium]|nr:VWA domain-containing protein [Bryobacteraceae bacterium]